MQRYGNRPGHSGIAEYELAPGRIRVRFVNNPEICGYDRARPGAGYVREMKKRAKGGRRLATYFSQHVGDNYARKYG
ncbi:hypothetical protein ACFWZU_07705 [Frateuria sp. GZRR33]|uniref:hypothetical protein n=1 Tax=Frateuria sp. GZRR33 TaxID=3351535 RepID=UPI003EDC6E7F